MHDIATIRREPEAFDAALARRGAEPVTARLLDLDTRRRTVLTELQDAQNRRNAASKAIGQAMGSGNTDEAERLKAEVELTQAEKRKLWEHISTLNSAWDHEMRIKEAQRSED